MKSSKSLAFSLVALPAVLLPLAALQASPAAKPTIKAKPVANQGPAIPKGIGGTWTVDPMHSQIGFAIRHVMINDIHGTFDDFEGTASVDEKDFTRSSVNFKAKIASVNTRVAARDNHLKSPDFFDAEKYPEMTFKSLHIARWKDGFRAMGVFTMHGVSKNIVIPFHARGPVVDGFGYTRASIHANFELNRQDYGVKWNQTLDNGGLAVDNIVRVNLDLEAIKAGSGPKKEEPKK
jgi:polyisoprenoid-binding protein YceI